MLDYYLQVFKKLRTDYSRTRWSATTCHRAPHKPLLLLAVIDLFAEHRVDGNIIEPTSELAELFTLYWSRVMPSHQRGIMALPFYHLKSDGFWHLIPKPGKKTLLAATRQIRSLNELIEKTSGSRLDEGLFDLLREPEARAALRTVLIETYFLVGVHSSLFDQGTMNVQIFYQSEELLNAARQGIIRESGMDETLMPMVRDQAFRRAIVLAYDHRCAFCGIRVLTSDSHTALEAAHIVPWSVSYDDSPTNGIGLCRLCHWTFDEGLLGVSDSYTLSISLQLDQERNLPGHLLALSNRQIFLPSEQSLYPDPAALAYHRREVFRRR